MYVCIKDLSVSYKGVQYNIDENWPWGQYTVVYKIPYDTDTINDGGGELKSNESAVA